MAEYGGKQRNQLSKVTSSSESKDVQLKRFIDNRPQAVSQMNLIRSIQKKPNNTGWPDNLKSGVENLSGYSMDGGKMYFSSGKLTQLQAFAYTQGTDTYVAPRQEKHLPHETWHVLQQKQGIVQPTIQMQGSNVNDNEVLEREADVMGEKMGQAINNKLSRNSEPTLQNVQQFYTVSDDHIRNDLRHEKVNKLFLESTIEDIEERLGKSISSSSNVNLEQAIRASRQDQTMDYNILSTEKLTSEQQIRNFLNRRPEDEHMYVLNDNSIHVAVRAESEKLPHPTLVGGDPDVQCAGTIHWDGENVAVDNSSGHFRPANAKPAIKKINDIIKSTANKQNKRNVTKKSR